MAKKTKGSILVKAAERVGQTLGRGARALDTVKAVAAKLASGTGRKKVAKKHAKKATRKPAKPAPSQKTRARATAAALNVQHGTAVDERARARSTSGERWAARNKPR